ncbi:MAG TPA: (Fe-S)-binding protein [Bryobacteraceae bacterium]|nr:(Fe-S)-binding protein [Bryobacteraceae bacterium]
MMPGSSPWEILLFLALLTASALAFWRRFGRVAAVIRRSRRDPDFQLRPLLPRMRAFFGQVMLQERVIRDRPLPGIAHAFVFWGFCAFALVTINHLVEGLGLELIPRDSGFGQLYFIVAAVFAVAAGLSIAGLAIRRFVARPKWLGEISPESGLVAFLIFFLMATYLTTFFVTEGSPAARINWWAHTLALLVFLPLIPHTKHLHLLLSPVTVFLKRPSFSRIPPLAGDEDFGLDTGRDLTRIVTLQAYTCVECGRCTEHCPAYNTGKVLNPKEIILGVRRYLNENGAVAEAPLIGRHLSQEAAFQCTTCGACEYQCPVGIQHLPVIVGLRRGAVNTGKWDDDHGNKLFLNLERYGNPLGFASSERDKFIEKHGLPLYDGAQEYCLWLGCMGSYDPQGREIVLAMVTVLRYLKVTFGVLKKERCTGDSARRLGNDLLFSQLAEANIEEIGRSKARRLVSICPHCVRTISEDWKEFGADIEIEHHSEFLARHRDRLPAASGPRNTVVFHDPCYLGRYRGTYEEPRDVIRLYGETVEPRRTRSSSFCCGAGGGLVFLGEEKGKRVNIERTEEMVATGAKTIAAACPFCHSMFRDALGAPGMTPPALTDIAQLAAAPLQNANETNSGRL